MIHASHGAHASPWRRLFELITEDRRDVVVLLVYTALSGLLALAVPLAAQAVVNSITAGAFLQPLVVLSALVLGGLILRGIVQLIKLNLVELLQQRIFARVVLHLSERLPLVRQAAVAEGSVSEMANRFFDVLTIQKALSKVLLDGPSTALKVLLGLVLLGVYSPVLLGFDIALIIAVMLVLVVFGIGGVPTAIHESVQKYRVAHWLEELGRCHLGFKLLGAPLALLHRADAAIVEYLEARNAHFVITFRQTLGSVVLQAVVSAGVLAVGGWLVIERKLSVGQLVAAELVVLSVLTGLEKLVRLAEDVYDLVAALDKVGHLTELPVERRGGAPVSVLPTGGHLRFSGVRFSYGAHEIVRGLNLEVEPGQRVALLGASGAGKSTLVALAAGLIEPTHGSVQVNGVEVRQADLTVLRRVMGVVGDRHEIFEGTIEENILMGRPGYSRSDLEWALDVAQLTGEVRRLHDGLETRLVSEGRNLSRGQAQRLLIARAVLARPQILVMDEVFGGVEPAVKHRILDALEGLKGTTLVFVTHHPDVALRCGLVHVLEHGTIAESGPPEQLGRQKDSRLHELMPPALIRLDYLAGGA